MHKEEDMIIDGQVFNKPIQKFYTEEQYKKDFNKINNGHFSVETICRNPEGKFEFGEHHYSKGPWNVIGYAVFDWYSPLPKNVREAIDNLEKENTEENAVMFLKAIKIAARSSKNNLSVSMYPSLMIKGYELCWDTDSAWAKIELIKHEGKLQFTACGRHGPGDYYDNCRMKSYCGHPEDFGDSSKIIRHATRLVMDGVNKFEIMSGDSSLVLSASYNKYYEPNTVAYKNFCKTYAEAHPIEMLNTYAFYALESRRGYDPWRNSRTSSEKTVSFEVRAKTKKDAYEKFKKQVESKNQSYGHMWFPGNEGRPHLKARPISEGHITFRPKKGELYC